jgi:hypothetical protein
VLDDAVMLLLDPSASTDIWGQLRMEGVHVVLVALEYGALGLGTILWFYYRRYLKNCDTDEAARNLKIAAVDERLSSHVERSGMEIQDIHLRMAVMAAQIKHVIPDVSIPEWPSR